MIFYQFTHLFFKQVYTKLRETDRVHKGALLTPQKMKTFKTKFLNLKLFSLNLSIRDLNRIIYKMCFTLPNTIYLKNGGGDQIGWPMVLYVLVGPFIPNPRFKDKQF